MQNIQDTRASPATDLFTVKGLEHGRKYNRVNKKKTRANIILAFPFAPT